MPFPRIRCTACSPNVTGAYTRDGHAFLLKAFNQPDFLEEVSLKWPVGAYALP
ncbi:hypothetical protein T484DRAFT_1865698 [Baffinella frigidus]|nr:hypothetical protein T484DRAFT_1865698 [Cryptophyta sp. CCMP2293]